MSQINLLPSMEAYLTQRKESLFAKIESEDELGKVLLASALSEVEQALKLCEALNNNADAFGNIVSHLRYSQNNPKLGTKPASSSVPSNESTTPQ